MITGEKKKTRFITHPDPLKSFFLRDTDSLSLEKAREAVIAAAESFKPVYNTLQDIKDKFEKLYPFSTWLTYNRTTLTDAETGTRISDAKLLNAEDKLSVWDHLYYQTIRRNNPTVRQACIQLIIADYFVRIYQETDYQKTAIATITTPRKPFPPSETERIDIFLRRIAQSRVLIHKAFSVSKSNDGNADNYGSLKPSSGLRELNKQHKKLKTKYRVEKLSRIKSELRSGMKLADAEKNTVEGLVEKAGKLISADTQSFIKTSLDKHTTLPMAEGYINEMIREENRKSGISAGVRKGKKTAKIPLYSYALSTDQREVLLTLNAGYMGAYLSAARHSISFGNKTIESESVTELGSDNKQLLLLKLFADQELDDQQNKQFSFKASFTLNNGSSIEIDTKGSANYEYTNGNAVQTANSSFTSSPPPPVILYGVHRLGIGVYRKVEQEVCCYVPGEVSRIENIMAREYKERQTRTLISTETTEEDTTEIEVENQSDTVSTNRNELQSEIAKQLSNDNSISFGASVGVSGSYAGVTVSADGSFDFASSTSSTSSNSEARTYAQEVTESALEKVVQKTTQKRTSKILEEYEENNRHGFDNREGTQHVTGVYRWIDIIYKNRLINYGKRLMIEFLIPEPAKFYKQALKAQAEAESGSSTTSELEAPQTLAELGVNSPSDITEDNYLELGRAYGVTLDEPISPAETTITKSFTPGDDPNGKPDPDAAECSYSFSLNFYETGDLSMYSAYQVKASYSFDYHLGEWPIETGTYFKVKVYDDTDSFDKDNLSTTSDNSEAKAKTKTGTLTVPLPNIKTELPVSVQCKNVYDFTINLTVSLTVDADEITSWQDAVYDALMKAYDEQLAEYEEAVAEEVSAAAATEEEQTTTTSSDFNRTVEQRELERVAIEMLLKPFGRAQGRNFYYTGTCDVPQVKQNSAWESYSSQVKFFEQAFDWSLMAYIFYPYYWAGKCSWTDLLQTTDATDSIFQGFLQSGMARMVVPVRPGFEEAVDYYMETGDTWNGGGLVMDTDDDLYVSIDEELIEIEGFVEKEWETRVPTTLTIIQGNSVYLEDEGLPCCHDEDEVDTLLRGSDAILGDSETDTDTTDTTDDTTTP